jgi:hypothetical protein
MYIVFVSKAADRVFRDPGDPKLLKRHRNCFLKMGISKNGGNWHLEAF